MTQQVAINMPETRRQLLMKILTDCVNTDKLTGEEFAAYAAIIRDVGIAAPPAPLGPTENVGSCEPSPLIRWDKTGTTWHTDTKAGRYSVRRLGKRQPFGAFLNNKRIDNVPESTSLDVVKRDVEQRIMTARRIANMSAGDARKALLG